MRSTSISTSRRSCLACLLYAPDKVGVGNQSKLGVLVETPLTNFKKTREICNNHLFKAKYHQNAVQQMKQVKMQETTAVGDISHQLKTQQDEEVANNRYLFRAVLHEMDFFARTNSALRGGDNLAVWKCGRMSRRSTSHKAICALHCRNAACSTGS